MTLTFQHPIPNDWWIEIDVVTKLKSIKWIPFIRSYDRQVPSIEAQVNSYVTTSNSVECFQQEQHVSVPNMDKQILLLVRSNGGHKRWFTTSLPSVVIVAVDVATFKHIVDIPTTAGLYSLREQFHASRPLEQLRVEMEGCEIFDTQASRFRANIFKFPVRCHQKWGVKFTRQQRRPSETASCVRHLMVLEKMIKWCLIFLRINCN